MFRSVVFHPGSLLILACLCLPVARAGHVAQTDWSAGPGEPGPVSAWSGRFEAASRVAWLPIPGQITLASAARSDCPEHLLDGDFDGACSVFAADMDGDGDNDILAAGRRADRIDLWRNEGGDPVAWSRLTIVSAFETAISVLAGDVDQDGDLDILGAAYDAGEIDWWRNDGGDPTLWPRQVVTTDFYGAHQVALADLDGDGRQDVLGVSQEGNAVAWWRNEGGSPIAWSRQSISDAFPMASSVHTADVNGDLRTDVVAASCVQPGSIKLWLNGGGSPVQWSEQTLDGAFALAHWVRCCDLDRDGDMDVLGVAYTGSKVAWWRNDGGAPIAWTRIIIDAYFYHVLSAEAFDLDGDGDLDVLGASTGVNQVVWWENANGTGTLWQEHMVDDYFRGAWPVHAADIDGDGDLDPVCAGDTGNDLSWWEATDFLSDGELTGSVLDLGSQAAQADLAWSADLPEGSVLFLQVRTGPQPTDLGAWGPPLVEPTALGPLARYVQYKVDLQRGSSARSPALEELELVWTSGSAECEEPASEPRIRLHVPSPTGGAIRAQVDLSRAAIVQLDVFSADGRLALSRTSAVGMGPRTLTLDGHVPPGVYLLRASVDDLKVSKPIVVLW